MDQRSVYQKLQEISTLPEGKTVVAGYLTALELQGMTDQDLPDSPVFVYCRETLPETEGVTQLALPFPAADETEEINGILCVTEERSMKDLIDLYRQTDVNLLMDVLARYYEEHDGSYEGLKLSEEQDAVLRKVIPDMLVLDCAWYS